MEKFNNQSIKTGAKKVIVTTSLVAALIAGLPTVAYADVAPANIIGDLETTEDRTDIKANDCINLNNRFATGCVTLNEVEQAITISNALNNYYFDVLNYTNTNVNELTGLNINTIYGDYTYHLNNGTLSFFCQNNLQNKPACDGFITLSSKTVANEIRASLANRVRDEYTRRGKTVTGTPQILINGSEISCLIKVNGVLRKVIITGDNIDNIIATINNLDYIYGTAISNLNGTSMANDGSFMYNGIDRYTGESVYLSLPDDDKKATITSGINNARAITLYDTYTLSLNGYTESLSKDEQKALRDMGYSSQTAKKARKDFISITIDYSKTLTK